MSREQFKITHNMRKRLGEKGVLVLDDDGMSILDVKEQPVWSTPWDTVHSVVPATGGTSVRFHIDEQRYDVPMRGHNVKTCRNSGARALAVMTERAAGRPPLGFEPERGAGLGRLLVVYGLGTVALVGVILGMLTLVLG